MAKRVELLAPAGDLEKLQVAIEYGADAVYLAGKSFGLRAFAGNFTVEEIEAGVKYAHERGKPVYVTVNVFPRNPMLAQLPEYAQTLHRLGVDAIIVADPGVFMLARQAAPDLPIHISTQANTTNFATVDFWRNQGAERVVLARELALTEIREIKERTGVELEVFVHGAMCMSYSGRCLLSNYMTNRDANQGECAQPCRWKYALVEESRPGQYMPIAEDEHGSYIFNSQDLSMIEHLPALLATGVDSLKIEGRMKSIHYVATVVKAYREALDSYYANPEGYTFNPKWGEEIAKVSHRAYTTGFYFGPMTGASHNYETSHYVRDYDFIGFVQGYEADTGLAQVEQRNHFSVGDEVEVLQPTGETLTGQVQQIINSEGEVVERAPHPKEKLQVALGFAVKPMAMVRRIKK